MTTYRIRGWDEHYETSESRKVKGPLKWVAMPTKHDGKTFRRVMRHDPSGALYGAWCLIVQVAAKCHVRGTLADGDGPLTPRDIADKTDLSADVVQQALAVFSSAPIRWLEPVDSSGNPLAFAESPAAPLESQRAPVLQDMTPQDTTEDDRR